MKTESWQDVWKVFEDAVSRPAGERQAYLDQACGDDRKLRRAVDELLAADREADSMLDRPIERIDGLLGGGAGAGAGLAAPSSALQQQLDRGATVGPYRIHRRIGQGGMSTVYLAERADDAFPRRVALKLVRPGLESEPILERLRTERRILASLDHPYVARLYDGGTTEEGLPYFVMEYVEGASVDTYCRQYRLSVDERLELFCKICESVHYAHQNLVIHRDIKPSNILVNAAGDPRLLDFGIAKLLNPGLTSAGVDPTATWQRILTPNYASPEQIRGKLITTATDVYSLGVLLYQLLTGSLPRDFTGCSPHEIEDLFSGTEPLPPSAAISESLESSPARDDRTETTPLAVEPAVPADIATADDWPETEPYPGPSPGELRKRLAGDLDAIVLKALRSAPRRRYGSVERLAADIERYRAGLPVEAHAGGWRYRAGKFVRRNRGALTAAAAAVMLVIGFAVAMAIQASRVAHERDLARSERDKKSQVLALVRQLFQSSNPYDSPQITVREVLEQSVPLMEHAVRDQPDVRAELLYTSGSILSLLGIPEDARVQLEEALEIRRGLSGEQNVDVVETMSALASALKQLGDLERAEELVRRAVEIGRGLPGGHDPALADALNELVSVLCWRYEHDAAEALATEALELIDGLPESVDRKLLALAQLAIIRNANGNYAEGARLNRESLDLLRSVYGDRHPAQTSTLNNLGLSLRRLDDFEGAEKVYREAIRLHREIFGKDDDVLFNNLAGVEFGRGKFESAEQLYRDGRAITLDTLGPKHRRVYSFDVRIASSMIGQGKAAEAEADLRDVLERWRPRFADHWRFDHGTSILGHSISVQGRCEEADPLLVGSFERLVGADRDRVKRDALGRLSEHLERCGRPEEVTRYAAMLDGEAEATD